MHSPSPAPALMTGSFSTSGSPAPDASVTAKRACDDIVDDESTDSCGPRKRLRSSSSLPTMVSLSKGDRRRVNPESLAARLGPELVADLDALVLPGQTEMPSFAARRDIQLRYNTDRRYIYDYYHAKGLRVVKEGGSSQVPQDRAETSVTPSGLRPIRSLPPKRLSTQRTTLGSSTQPRPLTAPLTTQPLKKGPRPRKNTGLSKYPASQLYSHPVPSLAARYLDTPFYRQPLQNRGTLPASNISDDVFTSTGSLPRKKPTVDSEGGRYSLPDLVPHSRASSSSGSDESGPTLTPLVDGDFANFDFSGQRLAADDERPRDDAIIPLDLQSLSQEERVEAYSFFSDALGPAAGLQESLGTYRTYMKAQEQVYYGNLLSPKPSPASDSPKPAPDAANPATPEIEVISFRSGIAPSIKPEPPARSSLFRSPQENGGKFEGWHTSQEHGDGDFTKWLMPTTRSRRRGDLRSSRSHLSRAGQANGDGPLEFGVASPQELLLDPSANELHRSLEPQAFPFNTDVHYAELLPLPTGVTLLDPVSSGDELYQNSSTTATPTCLETGTLPWPYFSDPRGPPLGSELWHQSAPMQAYFPEPHHQHPAYLPYPHQSHLMVPHGHFHETGPVYFGAPMLPRELGQRAWMNMGAGMDMGRGVELGAEAWGSAAYAC